MAKLNLQANCLTLTTTMKLADIKTCEKYAPEALCVRDDEGNKVFSICSAPIDSVSAYGMCFASETINGGFACMSEAIPAGTSMDEVVEKALVTYDAHITDLKIIEEQVAESVANIEGRRSALRDAFEPEPCDCEEVQ